MMAETMAKAKHRLREKARLCPPVHPSHQESSSPHLCCPNSSFFLLNNEQDNCLPRVAPERTARDKTTYPGYLLRGLHHFLY